MSPSKDPVVKNAAPRDGEEEAVQHAQGALQHRGIIEQVQSGRAGFGVSLGRYRVEEQGLGYH